MSITAITIENFKGIKGPLRVEIKPITLLFGPNSAGKSTIVQALHFAREIFERDNLNPDWTIAGGDSVDLGGFQNLVHNHDLSLPLKMRFDFNYDLLCSECWPATFFALSPEFEHDFEYERINSFYENQAKNHIIEFWLEITLRWSTFLGKPFISSSKTGFGEKLFAEITGSEDGKRQILRFLDLKCPVFERKDGDSIINILGPVIVDEENNLLELYVENGIMTKGGIYSHFPQYDMRPLDEKLVDKLNCIKNIYSSMLSLPVRYLVYELGEFRYIGPLRKVPSRGFAPSLTTSLSRWFDGLAAWDELYKADPSFVTRVNDWLLKMKIGYNVEVRQYKEVDLTSPFALALMQERTLNEEPDLQHQFSSLPVKRRLLLRDAGRDIEVSPADIGVGISQVLPVIVLALTARKGHSYIRRGGVLAIEQPELHIHPALQVALGDLFIEEINTDIKINKEKKGSPRIDKVIEGKIFLLETHSEHLMLRFLRRIRETSEQVAPENLRLTPADLSINFIEQGENGISCVPIRVDEDGEFIDKWPHGFFGERAGELF